MIVAGWQYLQYPEKVSIELSRIIKNDSLLIVSFTNRAFWTKSPNIWTNSSEQGRIEYVKNVLSANGWIVEKVFSEKTFENKLIGTNTIQRFEVNAYGKRINQLEVQAGDQGNSLRISIDTEIQNYTKELLDGEELTDFLVRSHILERAFYGCVLPPSLPLASSSVSPPLCLKYPDT